MQLQFLFGLWKTRLTETPCPSSCPKNNVPYI